MPVNVVRIARNGTRYCYDGLGRHSALSAIMGSTREAWAAGSAPGDASAELAPPERPSAVLRCLSGRARSEVEAIRLGL
jgi:hypothetical protein